LPLTKTPMKRTFVIASILLLAAACNAKPINQDHFSSRDACEKSTGKACGFAWCDVLPCPKNSNYWFPLSNQPQSNQNQTATTTPVQASSTQISLPVKYDNTEYGFVFSLPADWQGFSIYTKQWDGNPLTGSKYASVIHGPEIYIRNPNWTTQNPYEDIPVMVFTPDEWAEIQQEKLAVSAAPIPPSELGQNQKYVFALPPRYDYGFRTGFEEVEKIMQSSPLQGY
jgi:hypothetical protein